MDNIELLADLLAHPEKVGPAHASILKNLIAEFPYVQPLYQLLAKADENAIEKASFFANNTALFNLLKIESTWTADEEKIEDQDDEAVIDEIGEIVPVIQKEIVQPIDIETPKNLPGIDSHLMDLPVEDDHFIESVSASDFFAFEKKEITNLIPDAPEIETVIPDEPEVNFVSKYDDDQLPYTFLWWLAKTRKAHEQIFQPYAQPKPQVEKSYQNQSSPEFQQQYVEHIFHIQTPFEVADHLAEYPSAEIKDAKGAEIIDRFLKEDPTIKPPKPEQIDNENKAKKSAEDHYDLVSETLAKIYIEQMLYHKAIDTYKKLSLKYPEKSRYFADLIQSIEKKF